MHTQVASSSSNSFPMITRDILYFAKKADLSLTDRISTYFRRILAAMIQLFKRVLGMDDSIIGEDLLLENKNLFKQNKNLRITNNALDENVKVLNKQIQLLTPNSLSYLDIFMIELCLLPFTLIFFPIMLIASPYMAAREQLYSTYKRQSLN